MLLQLIDMFEPYSVLTKTLRILFKKNITHARVLL